MSNPPATPATTALETKVSAASTWTTYEESPAKVRLFFETKKDYAKIIEILPLSYPSASYENA